MIKKTFSFETVFELCHKKAWSLWYIYGYKRYFITCKIRDICDILGLHREDLERYLADPYVQCFCDDIEEVKP